MGKILTTLLTVVVAVIASAAIWVVANLIFDQVRRNWSTFRALIGAVCGFALGGILAGNRVIEGTQPGFLNWLWLPVVLAIVFALWFGVVTMIPNRTTRLVASVAIAAGIAVGLGVLVADGYQPELDTLALIGWTVGGIAVGAAVAMLRRSANPLPAALLGGAVGSIIGGWGASDIGTGSAAEAIVAFLVPALFIGARVGLPEIADLPHRLLIDRRSRAVIFLGPALLFIFATLVVPTIRTMYLSFLNDNSEEWVGLENYKETFQNPETWDASDIANIFTSKLFWIGVVAIGLAVFFGVKNKAATGKAIEIGNSTAPPLVFGAMFCSFALFAALRGTISNNLWWVVTVTFLATGLGLAIAVLSDGARFERTAKSFIFLPMAISLVGASVIWRFMYVARDTSQDQTGVMNALWVTLGQLSTGSGIPTILFGALLALLTVGMFVVMAKALTRRAGPGVVFAGGAAVFLGWITLRYWGFLGDGIGGFRVTTSPDGATSFGPETVDFVQHAPFNNMWLMVVLIWMQTGFAMVILSAAIKAVPTEFIEAAKMDGATTSQIFWRITVPQIAPTIGVVVTTLIVTVMKVFDIIKVMTNGQFGTQVLANDMYQQAFQFTNYGRGAALAVILFLSVLPVMVLNIRRMQREG